MGKDRIHNIMLESQYFVDFILNSLIEEIKDEKKIIREYKMPDKNHKIIYDAFLPSGVPGISSKKTILEIKYGNNPNIFSNEFNCFLETNNSNDYFFCYIFIGRQNNVINSKYAILGYDYVMSLANKHPILWWNFIALIDEEARVLISNDGEKAMMYGDILGGKDIRAIIEIKDISKLSEMNEIEFKKQIKKKSPSMICGNGVSIPFGSDSWAKMIDSLFDYLSPMYLDNLASVKKAIGDSNYFAAYMSKMTISTSKYNEALKQSIYRKYEIKMHNPASLLHSIVEIKNNNLNMPLLTYNYDCFIENDFKIFYPFTKIKAVSSDRMNKKTAEPKIQHIHGFCDNKTVAHPKNIILTVEEYFKSYKGNSWVVNAQKDALEKHTCLYVGSSMSDLFQLSVIDEVKSKLNSPKNIQKENGLWYCYALVCLKGLTEKDILTINNYYIRKSIRLIFVKEYEELPRKLLELF